MAAPTSFASILQQLVHAVRDDLDLGFNATTAVLIGSPQQVPVGEAANSHYLNFFFYHFSPYEFDAAVTGTQPLQLRAQCLITPFATDEDGATKGFNDLVLLGDR